MAAAGPRSKYPTAVSSSAVWGRFDGSELTRAWIEGFHYLCALAAKQQFGRMKGRVDV